jgi:hypothetical protein
MNSDWELIIEWLDEIIRVFRSNWFGHIECEKDDMRMEISLYKPKGSKFCVFRNNYSGWWWHQGWISTDCEQILIDKEHWLTKYFKHCYPFWSMLKWYGRFINWKNWDERGYIDSDWRISNIKRILNINNQLIIEEWFNCVELDNDELAYLDEKGRFWQDVEERNWKIYVKKDWKVYYRELLK